MSLKSHKALKDLKVGESVFIVHQLSRQARRRGEPPRTREATITKVGRKYAYINDQKFCRETGISVHLPDSNARANCFGFDVYVNEAAYQEERHNRAEKTRLQERLCDRFGRLKDLSPTAVQAIHKILDGEEESF